MSDWKKYLSPHGQSKQACEYVIAKFGNYNGDHLLIKRWVECSRDCLKEYDNDLSTM